MVLKHIIIKQTYFDSVTLMLIASEIKKTAKVNDIVVGMCTDYNIDALKRLNMYKSEFISLSTNDLIISVSAENEENAENAINETIERLNRRANAACSTDEMIAYSQSGAEMFLKDANLALISVPGAYAAEEAEESLKAGRHVLIFSDNVTIEEELRLKQIGREKNLFVMGPDCGTAIINGVGLAFANRLTRGKIGLVAASGTGLQEVTSTICRNGFGVSQAIGVGGRDLSEKIGGIMTIQAAQALAQDADTEVIVLISKPPAESVLAPLFSELKKISKPIVIYFIGADSKLITDNGFIACENLEDTAIKACELLSGSKIPPEMSDELIFAQAQKVKVKGKYIRGLYSGGTLCDEAQRLLLPTLGEIYSNTPVQGSTTLENVYKSCGHSIIDLGDDVFTKGRAHPMIDPSYRCERIIQEASDKDVGMILLDVVLGYGSHPNMAQELVNSITKAGSSNILYAASICGTKQDPQGYEEQKAILESVGVVVFPTNLAMVKFAARCFAGEKK